MKYFIALSLLSLSLFACSSTGSGSKGLGPDGQSLSETDLNSQREGRFGGGSIPLAEGEGALRDIHFDFDSSKVNDESRQSTEYNFQVLQANPDVKVQLEGHCDERGTAEYNLALGQSRASAVKSLLLSYGLPESRVSTISYGEEVPLDQGHTEAAWAKNRRVHFSPFREERRSK